MPADSKQERFGEAIDSAPSLTGWIKTLAGQRREAGEADTPCPLCSGTRVFRISAKDRHGKPLHTVVCVCCGLFRTDPLPSSARMADFHREQYRLLYKGTARPSPRRICRSARLAVSRWRQLGPYIPLGARVLDIGSGSGEWLYVLARSGRRPQGIEVDPCYAAFAAESYGAEVVNASLFDFDPCGKQFDVITAFHVLEHLCDPVAALKKCHGWLAGEGVLIVEVPNLASTRQNPSRLFHPAHVVGFTPGSLRFAAESAGFFLMEWILEPSQRNLLVCLAKQAPPGRGAEPRRETEDPLCGWFRYTRPALRYWTDPATYWRAAERLLRMGTEIVAGRAAMADPRAFLDRMIERHGPDFPAAVR